MVTISERRKIRLSKLEAKGKGSSSDASRLRKKITRDEAAAQLRKKAGIGRGPTIVTKEPALIEKIPTQPEVKPLTTAERLEKERQKASTLVSRATPEQLEEARKRATTTPKKPFEQIVTVRKPVEAITSSPRSEFQRQVLERTGSQIQQEQAQAQIQQTKPISPPKPKSDIEQQIIERTTIDVSQDIAKQQSLDIVGTKTTLPSEIKRLQDKPSQDITGTEISFSINAPTQPDQINLNPLRFFAAPGVTLIKTIQTRGGNILEAGGEFVESVKTRGVLATGKSVLTGTASSLATDPFGTAGEVAVGIKIEKLLLSGAAKTSEAVRFARQPELDAQSVFDPQSLKQVELGDTKFPTVKTVEESVFEFEKAGGFVTTASPSPIKGGEAGASRKGGLGLEDPGIFVTPAGKGSPAFLRLPGEETSTRITFNPLEVFRETFRKPTVSIFETQGIQRLPQQVIQEPGFSRVKEFFEERLPTGQVFITKRSELGTGAIKRQEFELPSGRKTTESGTTELEAVIPTTQPIEVGPVIGFTKVKGRKVGVREGRLPFDETPSNLVDDVKRSQKDINSQLAREQSALSSTLRNERVISPSGSISSIVDFKSRVSVPRIGSDISSPLSRFKSRVSDIGSSKPITSDITSSKPFSDSRIFPTGDSSIIPPPGGGSRIFPTGDSSIIPPPGDGSSILGGSDSDILPPPDDSVLPFNLNFQGKQVNPRNLVFNVFTRVNGIPTKINKKPLPISKAVALAKKETDNTLAASTELRATGKAKVKDTAKVSFGRKFVPRKTLNALEIVERPQFRLDTPGEKKAIQRSRSLNLNFRGNIL